ncbi:MAG: hypothetical protein WBZ39_02085 [Methylovirgula sp.]
MPSVESPNKNNNAIINRLLSHEWRMAGRPKHRSRAETLTISLPGETVDYLKLLAERRKLGPSEQDVAAYIIVKEVELMISLDFHERRFPEPKPD